MRRRRCLAKDRTYQKDQIEQVVGRLSAELVHRSRILGLPRDQELREHL